MLTTHWLSPPSFLGKNRQFLKIWLLTSFLKEFSSRSMGTFLFLERNCSLYPIMENTESLHSSYGNFRYKIIASCSLILVLKNRKDPHWALFNETKEPWLMSSLSDFRSHDRLRRRQMLLFLEAEALLEDLCALLLLGDMRGGLPSPPIEKEEHPQPKADMRGACLNVAWPLLTRRD